MYLKDVDPRVKEFFGKVACNTCELLPEYNLVPTGNSHSFGDIRADITTKPWVNIKGKFYCKTCLRIYKIEKIKENINNSI